MKPCSLYATTSVDRACAAADVRLTALERRRLIASLLARQHLILSGPAGIGKRRLAYSLALSVAQGRRGRLRLTVNAPGYWRARTLRVRQNRVRTIQGHPWWAAKTGDIAYYVDLQTEFSVCRLIDFVESILSRTWPSSETYGGTDIGINVVCVERMCPVEIDLYFRKFLRWLEWMAQDRGETVPLRLVGTYDSSIVPDLDQWILRAAALVHLG